MDIIYECAAKFVILEDYEYKFVVSKNRKSTELLLNFKDSDFFHLAGLQYFHSLIKADYLIESQFKDSKDTVYIFLKYREQQPNYLCLVSFFKKGTISYGGDILYWMLKQKISKTENYTLYRHHNY